MSGHDDAWGDFEDFEGVEDIEQHHGEDGSGDVFNPLFTVATPTGTVSATATLDGAVQQVDLDVSVADVTERQLAEQITTLGRLASQKAQAAQHAVIVELMETMGHDRAETSGFLERELGLPSPEKVIAAIAQAFPPRPPSESDWD